MKLRQFAAAVCITAFSTQAALAGYEAKHDPTPSVKIGAQVFTQTCALCHGDQGMGKGPLPLRMEQYPRTSLTKAVKAVSHEEILDAVAYGGMRSGISVYMPPFGKELTWTEIESVTAFIELLRSDNANAMALLEDQGKRAAPSKRLGRQVFASRCVLCHGAYGEGDGRMAKLLKNPPPADLTATRVPPPYMKMIINKGGEAVGRSKHMPPWGDQLSEAEVEAVVLFLMSIRD